MHRKVEAVTDAQRVVVVDDHRIFTDLVSLALTTEPSMECVATAATAAEARHLIAELRPDLALVDVRLPDCDGLDLAIELMALVPQMRVLMLTAYPRPDLVERARAMGVSGLLAKELPLADLLHAMTHATPEDQALVKIDDVEHDLTRRELQVLELLGEGRDTRAIARELQISVHTTRDHLKNVLGKLGAHTQLDAVVLAARAGILVIGAR